MKLLLDTHLLLWVSGRPDRLSKAARALIENPSNELLFSIASVWEIAIKHSLTRPDFGVDPRVLRRNLLENGYDELPILADHVLTIPALPRIHRDPFDRILVAQAMVEGITLVTVDPNIADYPAPIRLV